ncbi:hypothetical protein GLOTRDRAFT_61251 [Gloeophyllum trabeum ATCC 11539]|uniref:Major facilitator superfamily (MFS) profile domain-containing protein n=1 Tax=Gloeophyllum trabeum (strain ATCC 11539 / FP-39264 / Madison 617) TaxID=670483 RepID=S7RLM5_GLOTA|nr:uncharacterized protein GLOTRDRAFT_61251 [Gloeophyllum trabeum ATCC 11539]EPQ55310.1 hypothetical protein GLOTRDRAFT_61251 [Gloeophyllum trabeum ATCC 11539]
MASDLDAQPLLRPSTRQAGTEGTTATVSISSNARISITSLPHSASDSDSHEHEDDVDLTYTYAYGPSGLLGLLHNKYALGCALFASIGGWVFGYDQGVIANVLVMKEFLLRFPVGAWEKGVLTASLDLGALVGALLSGLADHYSRKSAIFWACIIFIIGTALQAFALSIFWLVLGRGLAGIGVGALSSLSPLYITEISPPELRGSLLALEQAYMEGRASVKDPWLIAELKGWRRLLSTKYRDRTMVGVIVMVIQQWSGINALLYYGPTLLSSFGLGSSNATLLVAGGVGIVQFLAVFPAIAGIDHWGRKALLRGGSIVMGCAHLVIAMVIHEDSDDWAGHRTGAWVAVTCLYVFTFAYGLSYGPVGWVLPSEVFPTSIRSKGVALSTMSNWTNNFLIGLLTPGLIELSPAWTFMVFSTACFLGYLWSTYTVPETAGVSLEEIDKFFRSSVGKEDAELRGEIERELGLTDVIRRIWEDGRTD